MGGTGGVGPGKSGPGFTGIVMVNPPWLSMSNTCPATLFRRGGRHDRTCRDDRLARPPYRQRKPMTLKQLQGAKKPRPENEIATKEYDVARFEETRAAYVMALERRGKAA